MLLTTLACPALRSKVANDLYQGANMAPFFGLAIISE